MANIVDYLSWRGDLSFAERPFNEVDNLILSEIAYAPMDGIVPGPADPESLPLARVCKAVLDSGRERGFFQNDPTPVFSKAAASPRFRDLEMYGFVNEINNERRIQFCALCFRLPATGETYFAFRGTDDSIVGWREDFNFSFLSETPGQSQAVRYLNELGAKTGGPLYVGGHSKGGNLAVYAAAFCAPELRKRIKTVYSNDGPGFNQTVAGAPEYRSLLPKVRHIIPESSLIGILLSDGAERTVIRSSAEGIQQHNPNTWEVEGPAFVRASQSEASQFADEALGLWLSRLSPQERENLTSAIFDTLDASGAATIPELGGGSWASYNAMLKAMVGMDAAVRSEITETWKKLAQSTRDVMRTEAKARLDRLTKQISAKLRGGASPE